jgi:hypothetical protein
MLYYTCYISTLYANVQRPFMLISLYQHYQHSATRFRRLPVLSLTFWFDILHDCADLERCHSMCGWCVIYIQVRIPQTEKNTNRLRIIIHIFKLVYVCICERLCRLVQIKYTSSSWIICPPHPKYTCNNHKWYSSTCASSWCTIGHFIKTNNWSLSSWTTFFVIHLYLFGGT